MAFYLNIECSKDIDELHIDFSDGTSTVVESKPKPSKKLKNPKVEGHSTTHNEVNNNVELDLSYLDDETKHESVQKPNIELPQRDVLVADELQDLNL